MSVRNKTKRFVTFGGQDQRWKGEVGGADKIVNMRVDPKGLGWLADRGLEPWWDPKSGTSITGAPQTLIDKLGSNVDSCFVWTKQNSGQSYYIIEQAGYIYYWVGNKNGGLYFTDYQEIASGRRVPKGRDIGTQYIPFGNRLLIINGYDAPIWFYGRTKARDFGFTLDTAAPISLGVDIGYLDGDALRNGVASPKFLTDSAEGLGTTSSKRDEYTYKMSFVSDSGSESPLSSATHVGWVASGTEAIKHKMGVCLSSVPIGPEGTASRRLYRSKNQKTFNDDGANAELYFLAEIKENSSDFFIDINHDGVLIDKAPSIRDSSKISSSYSVGANWNGRMWLAGGAPHPTRIIYSNKGLPEQFGHFAYFELGNTEGGHITGLQSYYNNLIVFRERSIDVIRMSGGSLTISQVSPNVGTTATNTIKLVPSVGICFLALDGIYALAGGMDGGSKIDIARISDLTDKDIQKLNKTLINNAFAGYSSKEREYWCHFPTGTDVVPTTGIVLHTDIKQWSSRYATTNKDLFRFSSMTVDKDGSFIFGTAPQWKLGSAASTPLVDTATADLVCQLYVWSGNMSCGKKWTSSPGVGQYRIYTIEDIPLPKSIYESNWMSLDGNDTKHRIHSVEVEIISYGDNKLELTYSTDYNAAFEVASSSKQNQAETLFTTSEDPVFGPIDNTVSKNFFYLDTKKLQDERVTRMRYDVNTGLITNFKFKLEMEGSVQTPFHILSFHINYNTSNQQGLNGGS